MLCTGPEHIKPGSGFISFYLKSNPNTAQCRLLLENIYKQISPKGRFDQFSSTYSPLKSEPGSDAKGRALGSWQLFRDDHLDTSKSSETKKTNSVSYNKSSGKRNKVSLPKLQDVPCQLFDQLKDELRNFTKKDMWLLNADHRETFAEHFGIHNIFPLYLDHSGFVMWFLDENNCLLCGIKRSVV